ncbi:MAG TPA: hypothetical protein VKT27_12480 [Candidatus Binataceae bacterium]|nr:hypothetical protein [Candidatus Binataceae bacterium]
MQVIERDDVKKFLREVWNEDTLTVLIRTHLHAEAKLIRLFEKCLPNPKALNIDRMTFARKVELASALRLVTDSTVAQLLLLNKLRNRFAHKLDAEIAKADVDAFLKSFSPAFQERLKVGAAQAANLKKVIDEQSLLGLRLRVCLIATDAGLLGNVDANLELKTHAQSKNA